MLISRAVPTDQKRPVEAEACVALNVGGLAWSPAITAADAGAM